MARVVGRRERSELRLWDCYRWDTGRSRRSEPPRHRAGFPTRFFQSICDDLSLCNDITGGVVPTSPRTSYRFLGIGLGLTFSDYELYRLAFRDLTFELRCVDGQYRYPFHAQTFLDARLELDGDIDPAIGFYQSYIHALPIGLGPGQDYYVDVELTGELGGRLVEAEIDPPDDWFAEVRIHLLGLQIRDSDDIGSDSTIIF